MMRFLTVLLAVLFPLICAAEVFDNKKNDRSLLLGAGAGLGAAYGYGLEVGYMINEHIDVNTGAGFNLSGGKAGIGSRLYFNSRGDWTPFVGINYVHSTGLDEVTVNVNDDEAIYKIPSNKLIHTKLGVRYLLKKNASLLGKVGYGFALEDNDAEYISGSTSSSVEDFANFVTAGGVEVSGTFLLRF